MVTFTSAVPFGRWFAVVLDVDALVPLQEPDFVLCKKGTTSAPNHCSAPENVYQTLQRFPVAGRLGLGVEARF
jgi:hypothetical protein